MTSSVTHDPGHDAADPRRALAGLWHLAGLADDALALANLSGAEPVAPSSYAVGTAAQVTIAAAALAAAEIGRSRTGSRQEISVDMREAALECFGRFTVEGEELEAWGKVSGLYPCGAATDAPGFVRIHANFVHHRDGALDLLGLLPGDGATKVDVAAALTRWRAVDVEEAAAARGLPIVALRSLAEWDRHPQKSAIAALPTLTIEKIGEAPPNALTPLPEKALPLSGLRVLELTRILAGPVAGRTLAAYGADVLLINSPNLPNIPAIADTSRGKLSAHLDLETAAGREGLARLVREAHVFVQGYRPGGLAARGFGPADLASLRPGLVAVSLSAYGHVGPWADRRGFDSLVQTATGLNHSEGEAFGQGPRALPMQILDYCSGFLIAFGAQAALIRQAREGGSWHVRVSLAQTAHWLRSLGRVPTGLTQPPPNPDETLCDYPSGFGALRATPHAARFSRTPWRWSRSSVPPGTNPPEWPEGAP